VGQHHLVVHLGRRRRPQIRGDNPAEHNAYQVRDLGDLDGDGTTDFAVGSSDTSVSHCGVYLFFGPLSASAVLYNNADADGALLCDGLYDGTIDSIAAGDVTGDGVPDLIAGSQFGGSQQHGPVYVFPGVGY